MWWTPRSSTTTRSASERSRPSREYAEPITFTDKRRIDPETGEVRANAATGPAPSGPAPEVPAVDDEAQNEAAELLADLQRVQADFANYRKRALRDQQLATERAKAQVVTQLLPVLDDLDRRAVARRPRFGSDEGRWPTSWPACSRDWA